MAHHLSVPFEDWNLLPGSELLATFTVTIAYVDVHNWGITDIEFCQAFGATAGLPAPRSTWFGEVAYQMAVSDRGYRHIEAAIEADLGEYEDAECGREREAA